MPRTKTIFQSASALCVLSSMFLSAVEAAPITAIWNGGDGVWSNGAQWDVGVAPQNGADRFSVMIDGGASIASNAILDFSATIDNLTVDSDDSLAVLSGADLSIVAGAESGTLNNAGLIRLNAFGNPTRLLAEGGIVTLTGGGAILLDDSTGGGIAGAEAPSRFVNLDNAIRGAGGIGMNVSGFDNHGVIVANLSTPLVLDPGASEVVTNTGTMRAESGATLQLGGGRFVNAGGVIEADDNSIIELNSATIEGGTLRAIGGGLIRTRATETLDGGAGPVMLAGTLEIRNADHLDVIGALENSGLIRLNSTGTYTQLRAKNGDATLNGGGVIDLGIQTRNRITGYGAGDRIINVDNTIRGAGTIGQNSVGISNHGTIVADVPAQLLIAPGSAHDMINTGTIRAENGATVKFGFGTCDNSNGTIEAMDGSIVEFGNSLIIAGTLRTEGDGVIRTAAVDTLDGAVTPVNNAGLLEVTGDTDLILRGALNNTGTVRLTGSGGNSDMQPDGDVMLVGGGVIQMDRSGSRIIGQDTAANVINVDNTIHGAGNIGGYYTEFTNQSLVVADAATQLYISLSNAAGATNLGTMRAADGGTLSFSTGIVHNIGGVIEALDGSIVLLHSTTIEGGTLRTEGAGTIQTTAVETLEGTDEAVVNLGAIEVNGGDYLYFRGTLQNAGTITLIAADSVASMRGRGGNAVLAGGGVIELGDDTRNSIGGDASGNPVINEDNTIRGAGVVTSGVGFINRGRILADRDAEMRLSAISGGEFVNEGLIDVIGTGGLTMTSGPIRNHGVIHVGAGSSLSRSGNYVQTGGETILDGPLLCNALVDIQGGTLAGSSLVDSGVLNAGTISPNGLLEVTYDLTQEGDGRIAVDINGPVAGVDHDQLAIHGHARLNGTLSITIGNEFTPQTGDAVVVVTYPSHDGEFQWIDIDCAANRPLARVDILETSIVVSFTESLVGDANCDCARDFEDIEAFISALLDLPAYEATYDRCTNLAGVDLNGDTRVDGLDLQEFVDAMLNQ
ncbi:MAG TPA: hypothetical protein PK093_16645 [Phycisphaerae bacterium]|nr:hypothetical protein [Phycisphaerae bacterium]